MSKVLNKLKYGFSDIGSEIVNDGSEALLYWLHFCRRPFSTILFNSFLMAQMRDSALRQKFYRYHKRGYIKRITKKGKSWFSFNKEDRYSLIDGLIGEKSKKFNAGWDKKWRLIIYDIPDKYKSKRDDLREYLVKLGFGCVQDSCLASCYDYMDVISVFCQERKISDYICLYQGEFFTGGDESRVVKRSWPLETLKGHYDLIAHRAKGFIREVETKNVVLEEYYRKHNELFKHYVIALRVDPFLPLEFSEISKNRQACERALFKFFKLFSGKLSLTL